MNRKQASTAILLAVLVTLGGCKKKVAPTAPAAPPPPAAAPTADITATPTVVTPGQQVVLTWHTTNATEVSIDGIGNVATSGTQSVSPTESTNYHLIARGDGGSTDATARVTVSAPAAASSTTDDSGSVDEALFHQQVQDIFYDYDSYDVRGDAEATLAKDAQFLMQHPKLKIVIGGYCDERGSNEYNLALGENRANSAKTGLVNAGISADRIRVVSYGKEKQFCSENNEQCWQQNRRAGFNQDR